MVAAATVLASKGKEVVDARDKGDASFSAWIVDFFAALLIMYGSYQFLDSAVNFFGE